MNKISFGQDGTKFCFDTKSANRMEHVSSEKMFVPIPGIKNSLFSDDKFSIRRIKVENLKVETDSVICEMGDCSVDIYVRPGNPSNIKFKSKGKKK